MLESVMIRDKGEELGAVESERKAIPWHPQMYIQEAGVTGGVLGTHLSPD
jgi:hypothetical protein